MGENRIIEVRDALVEQEGGNQQVLNALRTLNQLVNEVRDGSMESAAGTSLIARHMREVAEHTDQVNLTVETIVDASDRIDEAVRQAEQCGHLNLASVESARKVFSGSGGTIAHQKTAHSAGPPPSSHFHTVS